RLALLPQRPSLERPGHTGRAPPHWPLESPSELRFTGQWQPHWPPGRLARRNHCECLAVSLPRNANCSPVVVHSGGGLMTRLALSAAVLGTGVGCTAKIGDRAEPYPEDQLPPTVEVTAPTRGTLLDGMSITVTGRATDADSGIKSVTINGKQAELSGDG